MNFKAPDIKQIIIIAVGILLIVGAGVFRCKPLLARTKHLKVTKAEQDMKHTNIREQMEELPHIGEEMEELRQHVGNYHKKIPNKRDFSLWGQIAELMNSLGLKEQLIKPGNEVLGEEINSIEVTIKCGGSSSQIFDFFKKLVEFERVVRIENITLTNSTTDLGYVTMDTKAKIYFKVFDSQDKKVQ